MAEASQKLLGYNFIMKKISISFILCFVLGIGVAQHGHPTSLQYQPPTDPLVSSKLEKWQDLKFGMIIHWGLYAEAGIIESWSLCSEDWVSRDSTSNYGDYKEWYWNL